MRITSMDIRQQQFTVRMFRGFDVQEVDTFLEDLADDYETLMRENALLKEQLQAMEERLRGLEDRERVLKETLVTTHRLVEDMKAGAQREADLQVKEAEMRARKIVEGAQQQGAQVEAQIAALRKTRRQLAESLRATLDMFQRLLEQEPPGDAEPAADTPPA
jgi:cell division initiation protein